GLVQTQACLDRYRQVTGTFTQRGDEFGGQFRRLSQSDTGTLLHHAPVRTAHIDVYAVKTQLAGKFARSIQMFRLGTEKLRHDRMFTVSERQVLDEPLSSGRSQPMSGDEFRIEHIRPTASGDDGPKWHVVHICHRRQDKKWLFEFFPKSRGHIDHTTRS